MKYTIIDGELYRTDELYHHGVKGMRWGVRRERKSRAERIKERTEARQARAEARKAKERIKQDKIAYKTQTQKLKTDLLNQINQRLQADKTKRELSVKMTKQDRRTIAKLKGEQAVAAAEADKLAAENRIRDEKKKAQGVVQKLLSKLGWAAVDGVAEAGKNLIKDKLIAFGKEKLGLNKIDPDEELKKESSRATWKANIKKNDEKRYKELFGDDETKAEDSKKEDSNKEEAKREEPKKEESKYLALPASPRPDRYGGRSRQEILDLVRKANEESAAAFKKRNENNTTTDKKKKRKKKK